MGSVVISHLIGTVSLLLLFTAMGTYYTVYFAFLQSEVVASSLQEISEYCTAETVDMVTLCQLSVEDQMLFKKMALLSDIKGNTYTLTITSSGGYLKVITQLSLDSSVFGEALLPWSVEGSVTCYNGTDPGIGDSRVNPQVSVSSDTPNLIVWCLKSGGKTTIGLGTMEE